MLNFSAGKREIKELCVKCHNVERSCGWEGTIGTVDEHEATCELALVPCPQKCEEAILRRELMEHVKDRCPFREYQCQHCQMEHTYAHITGPHDEICPKKVVPCANADCTETVERKGVKRHLEECPFTEVSCKYTRLGCDV